MGFALSIVSLILVGLLLVKLSAQSIVCLLMLLINHLFMEQVTVEIAVQW